MKALITGGCGFVGSNLAAHLLERESAEPANITVFDNLSRNGASANLKWLQTLAETLRQPVRFVHGDMRQVPDVDAVVRDLRPDVVFHLAGQVAMTTSLQSPRRDFDTNVVGSVNLLEAVREHSPDTGIVYASSNKVYGNLQHLDLVEGETRYHPRAPEHRGVDESAPLEFHTPYGCSKGAADQYMLDYARAFGLRTVVFRHSTIYGGRQFATYDQGWVGWFVRQALESQRDAEREPFTVSGDGKQVRDLLHVSDAVRCYVQAFESMEEARGHAFNIGGGVANSMSLLELLRFLEARLGVQLRYTHLPWRHSDQRFFVADNAKAERVFAWRPEISRETGLESVLEWESAMLEEREASSSASNSPERQG